MHRRFWLLAGVGAAALAVVAAAGATAIGSAGVAPSATAAHKAKSIMVLAMEQDATTGFNANEADFASAWAVETGVEPSNRGIYIIDNKGDYHLDLASSVKATKKTLTITIRPDAFWY